MNSFSIRQLSPALLAALFVLAPAPARGWSPSTVSSSSQFIPLQWSGGQVTYRVNATHGSNIVGSNAAVEAAADAGFAAWDAVTNANLSITKAGSSSDIARNANDAVNTVLFADVSTSNNQLGGALAVTFTIFSPTSGNLNDADIVFNTNQPFFTTVVDNARFDLQSVLTHEIGHLLGLDHSSDVSATMFQSTPPGNTEGRTLGPDDLAAIRTTYPGATSLGSLSGRVLKNSSGVKGAAVFAIDARGVLQAAEIVRTSDGSFTVQGLPPGVYSVGVEPLDGPMRQSNIGGHYQLIGTFDTTFITRAASGAFTVTGGSTTPVGDLTVSSGTSKFTLGNVVGITQPNATSFSFGTRVAFIAGTTGKELLLVHDANSGVTSATQIAISGSDIVLGTPTSGTFSGGTTFRRFPLTVPLTSANGGHVITFTEGSDSAVISGGFDVSGGQDASSNEAPTADAGSDQAVQQGAFVQLNGSGSDPDNDTLSFQWTQTQGTSVTLQNAGDANASFSASSNGIFEFQLLVSDGQASDTDTVTVRVNGRPTAQVPAGQTVTAGSVVTLSGGGSDPDLDTLTFQWEQLSGPETLILQGATTSQLSFTPSVAGDYGFSLTVDDGNGGSDTSAAVTISVQPANQPPVADAGPNQTVTGTATVTLSASASSDPDGDTLTYLWQQVGGPATVLADSPTRDVSFSPSDLGTYQFRLTVSDGFVEDSDEISVTRQSLPPVASVTGDTAVFTGTEVSLSASGSSDPDGETLTYVWTQKDGQVTLTLQGSASETVTFTPDTPGSYTLRLTLRDASGTTTTRDTPVTVERRLFPPTADAGSDRTVAIGALVILDAQGSSDPQQATLSYLWEAVSIAGAVTLDGSGTAQASFTPLVPGDYDFRLTASSATGLTASDTVRIVAEASAAETTTTLALDAGLNLISLPLQPATTGGGAFSSEDLALLVGSRFVISTAPGSDRQNRFRVFDDVLKLGNFEIEGGQGYLVSVPSSRTVTLSGTAWPASAATVELLAGANLIGVSSPSATTVSASSVKAASQAGLVAGHQPDTGTGRWKVFVDSAATADFTLEPGQGYVVVVEQDGQVAIQ